MNSGRPELRASSIVSALVSCLVAAIAFYYFATDVTTLSVLALLGSIALAVSCFWHIRTGSKSSGRIHGVLMVSAAIVFFLVGYRALPDRSHPKGEMFDMLRLLGAGLWICAAIIAAGCSLAVLLRVRSLKNA
jgi:hypothetical protein